MKVLVLSKTRMQPGRCCIGGISETGEYVRLLTENGENQQETTELLPSQVWEIDYVKREHTIPPHIEDVLVRAKIFQKTIESESEIIEIIHKLKAPIWEGPPNNLFDKKIKWTGNGRGYIDKDDIPSNSVGFWISDDDLTKNEYNGIRYRHHYEEGWRSLKFVGYEEPVDKIPAGTLLRVSLARWWKPDGIDEERCYLQLSGWYDL